MSTIPLKMFLKDCFLLKGVLRNIDDADVLSENFCESLMNQSREEKKDFF